jgi:hypothetical protein
MSKDKNTDFPTSSRQALIEAYSCAAPQSNRRSPYSGRLIAKTDTEFLAQSTSFGFTFCAPW